RGQAAGGRRRGVSPDEGAGRARWADAVELDRVVVVVVAAAETGHPRCPGRRLVSPARPRPGGGSRADQVVVPPAHAPVPPGYAWGEPAAPEGSDRAVDACNRGV